MKRMFADKELPCPRCKSTKIEFYRLFKYRPKEFVVKCDDCGIGLIGKGNHLHVLIREWNKAVNEGRLQQIG